MSKANNAQAELVGLLRKLAHDLPEPTCPAIDRAIAELENLRHDNTKLRYGICAAAEVCDEAAAEIERMAGEVERLRAALQPFASLADRILAEAPAEAGSIALFRDSEGTAHTLSMDELRALERALGGGE